MQVQSLSHTSWECVYHIVWIPKYRRKVLWNEVRVEVGQILRTLVEHMDGVEMVEGTLCPDHVHMCLRIAPKHSVSKVVGKIKGRSAITLFERHPEWRGVTGRDRTFWARGYYVSTVGLNETVIRRYIQNQEEGSKVEQRRCPLWGLDGSSTRQSRLCRPCNEPLRGVTKAPGYAGG